MLAGAVVVVAMVGSVRAEEKKADNAKTHRAKELAVTDEKGKTGAFKRMK
jgi:hypothetical protein